MCSSADRRWQAGLSLIELLVAIVVISVALAGVLRAFAIAVTASTDPMIRKQMLAIAEEMQEEIALKPFAAAAHSAGANCARDTWNNITDYDGYNSATVDCKAASAVAAVPTIYDISGAAMTALNGYAVKVVVADASLPAAPQANPVAAPNCKKITITVTHGPDTLVLVGWRTNYAA